MAYKLPALIPKLVVVVRNTKSRLKSKADLVQGCGLFYFEIQTGPSREVDSDREAAEVCL